LSESKLELLFSSWEKLEIKMGKRATLVVFEINVALWLMIGCGIAEAVQFY
jgi:hypothetical protein